jgi:type III secretory pathway lipoprotein EscJ
VMPELFRIILATLLVLFCSGCRESVVLYDLSQTQVQEVVAALHKQGISSSVKRVEGGSSGKFSVFVSEEKFADAHAILVSEGLPRPQEPSLSDLVEPTGFLPQPRKIELLRFDRARALEVRALLEELPEVISAEVVFNTFSDESLPQDQSLSAVVKTVAQESELKPRLIKIIRKAIPGLSEEQIGVDVSTISLESLELTHVTSQYTQEKLVPFLWIARVPEGEYAPLAVVLSICILAVAFAGGVVGFWWRIVHFSRRPLTGSRDVAAKSDTQKIGKKRLVEIDDAR